MQVDEDVGGAAVLELLRRRRRQRRVVVLYATAAGARRSSAAAIGSGALNNNAECGYRDMHNDADNADADSLLCAQGEGLRALREEVRAHTHRERERDGPKAKGLERRC